MLIESRAAPPFMKNGFVLADEATREGVLIDPGDEVEELLEVIAEQRLTIRYILLTHAHLDHITGVGRAREALGVPVVLHEDDRPALRRHRPAGHRLRLPASSRSRRRIATMRPATSSASAATKCGRTTRRGTRRAASASR